VLRKVKEHDLPIEAKQIAVQRINTPGISAVYLSVNYSVTINLPGYSFDMSSIRHPEIKASKFSAQWQEVLARLGTSL